MNANEIRLARKPKMKMFAPTQVVAGFEIKWDERIQAWEMAKPNPMLGGIYSFRIGRVVNGQVFITEMVTDLEPSVDELSIAAADALAKVGEVVDLGEWVQEQVEEESDSDSLDGSFGIDLLMADRIHQDHIALLASRGAPTDMATEGDGSGVPADEDSAIIDSDKTVAPSALFGLLDVLIERFLKRKNDFLQTRQSLFEKVSYNHLFARDGDGNLISVRGAVIPYNGRTAVIDVEFPSIVSLFGASSQRSLRDRIRALSEFVCILGQLVGLSREVERSLRDAVRLLGLLIGEYRDDAGNDADRSGD